MFGGLVCWLASSIYLLLLGRFLQGLGVEAGTALARPILRDLLAKEMLAIYNSYLAISSVAILTIAPILGGYIQYYLDWRCNFLFLSIYGLFTLGAYYYIEITMSAKQIDNSIKWVLHCVNRVNCFTVAVTSKLEREPTLSYRSFLSVLPSLVWYGI
jgi:MFS family permease